jgi:hypothetical protein
VNDIRPRTPINTLTIPTFEHFILESDGTEDAFRIFAADGFTLLGMVERLPKYRGKISRQWNVSGFSKYGTFVFNFEQVEQIVNKWLADNRVL